MKLTEISFFLFFFLFFSNRAWNWKKNTKRKEKIKRTGTWLNGARDRAETLSLNISMLKVFSLCSHYQIFFFLFIWNSSDFLEILLLDDSMRKSRLHCRSFGRAEVTTWGVNFHTSQIFHFSVVFLFFFPFSSSGSLKISKLNSL